MKWSNHHSQWKSLKCSTWVQSQKYQNDLCSFPSLTIQYHGIIHFYAPTTNAKEAEVERFYEDLQDLLELTPKKDVLFIIGESEVAQSCPTLCDPMDCSLPGFSVHGILQARILEWITISFSRGSPRPRDRTQISHIGGRCFNLWATREALECKS